MNKYEIKLVQQIEQRTTVWVEADNEDDAREKAERDWWAGNITAAWTDGDIDESFGVEAEVMGGVEEVKPDALAEVGLTQEHVEKFLDYENKHGT